MKVILSPQAEKQLRKIGKVDQIAIAKKIREIGEARVGSGAEKITGFKSVFRFRIGDYRLVYKQTKKMMYVVIIGHRRDVYKLMKRLLG